MSNWYEVPIGSAKKLFINDAKPVSVSQKPLKQVQGDEVLILFCS